MALWEFPVTSLAGMVRRTKAAYKVRGHNIISVNTHWLIAKACKFIKKVVDPRVGGKIHILSNDYFELLDDLIGRDNFEKRFGGNLPDKKNDFFPPRYN